MSSNFIGYIPRFIARFCRLSVPLSGDSMDADKIARLRKIISENIKIQRGGGEPIPYIDIGSALGDATYRQNHVIFGRRGCGKSLLLHYSASQLPKEIRTVYLNCEDFKKHSFPNVLIEILYALFEELEKHQASWFTKGRRSREIISDIKSKLVQLKQREDQQEREIRESKSSEFSDNLMAGATATALPITVNMTGALTNSQKHETEFRYKTRENKMVELDLWLPDLKRQIREFFDLSSRVKTVYLQIDDFYQLQSDDQPFVIDYVHRLCKDLPIFFKVATLRHSSRLYTSISGQPIGVQERHDFQPIDIDFTFSDIKRTIEQNRMILHKYGELAGISNGEIDDLFKGEGFSRLVISGGGVPRDCLSIFLNALGSAHSLGGDGYIGKDEIRSLSLPNFDRRIRDLKEDSSAEQQSVLIKGVYVLREFCIDKRTNVILVPESLLREDDSVRGLLYSLLDYRIIHSVWSSLTHKSQSGTYHAFVIDIGCYANLRKLYGKINEIDPTDRDAKEKMRSVPIFDRDILTSLWNKSPDNVEDALMGQNDSE